MQMGFEKLMFLTVCSFLLLVPISIRKFSVVLAQPNYAATSDFYHNHIENSKGAHRWGRQDWMNWRDARDQLEDIRRQQLQHQGLLPRKLPPLLRNKRLNSVLLTTIHQVAISIQARQRGLHGSDVWSDPRVTIRIFQQLNRAGHPNNVIIYKCPSMYFSVLLNYNGWPYHLINFNPTRFERRPVSFAQSCTLLR